MIKAFLFDLSRTLLFPVDKDYAGELNKLHSELSSRPNYSFFENFQLDEGIMSYLKSIRDKYELYVFTSGSIQDTPEIKGRLDEVFKKIYSSEKIGLSKKDPKAYEHVAKDIGMTPDEILFVDDSEANVKAAKTARMNAVIYSQLEKLRDKISEVLNR